MRIGVVQGTDQHTLAHEAQDGKYGKKKMDGDDAKDRHKKTHSFYSSLIVIWNFTLGIAESPPPWELINVAGAYKCSWN